MGCMSSRLDLSKTYPLNWSDILPFQRANRLSTGYEKYGSGNCMWPNGLTAR
ncbi:hypothetical protein AGR8A_Lc40407 [Agrobacterium fabrum str. J-07]|nr:hypothetical protein AGR8A_Lc40407 [Agrobacterium fabrum str. J-07]